MLFLIILLVSLLLRISRFDFPFSYTFAWGDGTRDYLVASHVLKFHEFPLVGPYNLLNDSGIYNSPAYFYVLSLLLIPYNNVLALSFINILLQLGVIILIYIITKRLFDYPTAIIASLLFSFNPEVIKQADFVWQPYVMMPVALLALYLQVRGKQLIALIILCLAAVLHNGAFPWLVAFFCMANVPFRKKLAIVFFTLTLLYFPLIIFYLHSKELVHYITPVLATSFSGYFTNFVLNMNQLLSAFYINSKVLILLAIGLIVAVKQNKDKKTLLFLILLFILPIFTASFFNKLRLHYIILSLAVLPILIAKMTSIFRPVLRLLIVGVLLLIFSGGFSYFKEIKQPLENQMFVDDLTSQVVNELSLVKKAEGFSDFDFFQVVSLMRTDSDIEKIIPYPVLDTFLLIGLEDKLQRQLINISDSSPYNHSQVNNRKYLVISCFKSSENERDCLNYFAINFPDFNILKKVYNNESIGIYLAKHVQI